MKKVFTLLISLSLFYILIAQHPDNAANTRNDGECYLRFSLLTCTPGTELYSTFGHSAIRVTDISAGTDIIFNYGTFDFDDPAFLPKFVRGKLLYFVSIDEFKNFLDQYIYEKRGISEQVLDLSCAVKKKLLIALHDNAKEENRYYKYDFVYDNCTTRVRDIIFSVNDQVETKNIRPKDEVTFRNLIHEYLDNGHHHWSKLGIDILLGSPLDKKLINSEAMFLPDYLLKAFDSTTLRGKPLVTEKNILLKSTMRVDIGPSFTPFLFFTLLLIIIVILSFVHGILLIKKLNRFFIFFDFILFFLSGAFGVLLLFMWLGTDHQACRNNFNLAWAFPSHLIVVFYLFKKRSWLRYYFFANAFLLFFLLMGWKWLPQEMNNGLLPVVGLLMFRSFILFKKMNNG